LGQFRRARRLSECEATTLQFGHKAFTGPLVDRIGPRAVSWTIDLASATAAAAVPLLHALDLLSFPLLLVLVALIGATRGPGDLAKEVMVPEAAERSRVPLERATGLAGVIEWLASTVGLAVGGSLVALLGPLTGLAASAGCFALGSVIIKLALPRGMGQRGEEAPSPAGGTGPGYWRQFGEGFTFLRGEPLLLTVIVMFGITNLLDAALNSVLVPVWAGESGNGPTAIGLMGSVMGAVLVERVPRRMLGRVNALGDSPAWAGIPLGGLLAGAAVTAAGLVPVLLTCGAAYFLTTNLAGLRPEWREMDRRRERGVVKPHSEEDASQSSANAAR
jgi:hypothetical protein